MRERFVLLGDMGRLAGGGSICIVTSKINRTITVSTSVGV